MEAKTVEKALVNVIKDIQSNSGLDCPELGATTRPAEQVPKFDSKIWIAATTMLSGALGVIIPDETNIFFDKKSKAAMSIEQIVHIVCSVSTTTNSSEDAA